MRRSGANALEQREGGRAETEGPRLRHPSRARRRGRGVLALALVLLGAGGLGGCSLDGLLKSDVLPPDVTDPAITETPDGARNAYRGTLYRLQQLFGVKSQDDFVVATGLLSDELSGTNGLLATNPVSLRQLEESPTGVFEVKQLFMDLNTTRQRARQAGGLVSDYLSDEPALRAHLYAIEGYTEVMLAELFCSGIPLSTVDYRGDYTLQPGSSTEAVFTHAAALFESALGLAGTADSARILNLSRMGRGRALLGAGDYAAAAAAVAEVPDDFRYTIIQYGDSAPGTGNGTTSGGNGVQDREGTNGLDYRSSGDPRTRTTLRDGFYDSDKYHPDGKDTVVLASGVEARLIEAEDALHRGDASWLDKLNALRTDGTQETVSAEDPDDPSATVTRWSAGTGGVPGLAPLADPGTPEGRVDLLFRERAFWLFLTGHRQGDMRRLVRQYHRPQDQVYPVGTTPYGDIYGGFIDLPIPWTERELNPLFTGCGPRN